jgi:8-oxo-dGTP pyrophosphatase MutT (NUDIX family)
MIWSVSLVFYHPTLGYLVGQELRKKEKDFCFHPVGGKVEVFDKDPLDTAVREFIEETSLIAHGFFTEIANNNFRKWISTNEINLNTKYPRYTTWIQNELYDYCSESNVFYDHNLLNSHKIHRYYIVDMSKINNNELNKSITEHILNLPFTYNQLEPQFRVCDKMWSLFWIPFHFLRSLPDASNLIYILHDKIKKSSKPYEQNKKLYHKQKPLKENNEEKKSELDDLYKESIEKLKIEN